MTLKRIRYCDECGEVIEPDKPFISTEGIYVDGLVNNGEGVDIVTDQDICSPDCLYAFVRARFDSCVREENDGGAECPEE